jgi:dTDP-glucose pyrophosphorylase
MMGIVPAAGLGTRIQPLAFSKELLPVGSRAEGERERPRAVGEYVVERLIAGGADRLCFVISADKTDIMSYFGSRVDGVPICYVVQGRPAGLCDAIFSAVPFVADHESVVVGLPDTVWFPPTGLRQLPESALSFLLFPVTRPDLFDAVVVDDDGRVVEIEVKNPTPRSSWIWGAFKIPPVDLRNLHELWLRRDRADQYFGTLINAYLQSGGNAVGVKAGTAYVDVGTFNGYREALELLMRRT